MNSGMPSGFQTSPEKPCTHKNRSHSQILEKLLPKGVAAAEHLGEGDPRLLWSPEREWVEGAAPKRLQEFSAGRVCARRALARLGIAEMPIRISSDHRALWPESVTGSITHTDGFTAAVIGERNKFRAIGIDAEVIRQSIQEISSHILIPAEKSWVESLPAAEQAKGVTLMFSAKEAFYKCQYEVTQQWLDFKDVALEFFGWNLERGGFMVHPVRRIKISEDVGSPGVVHFAVAGDLVLAASAITAQAKPTVSKHSRRAIRTEPRACR